MPGAVSEGDTREDTLANIVEAMTGWLEVASEHGFGPLPETAELVAGEIALVLGFRAEEHWPLILETTQVEVQVAVAA
jgi:predicted RNase H-like HicB family nuclease